MRRAWFPTVILAGLTGAFLTAGAVIAQAAETRIKDVTRLEGEREHKVVGLGLVVGLAGTGDSADFLPAIDALANVLVRFRGFYSDSSLVPRLKKAGNVAIVEVTCTLPPYHRVGDKLTVTVSSIGSAKSLAGGMLLPTPLQGSRLSDDSVYAVAEGPVSGYQNATTGYVTNGGIVEKTLPTVVVDGDRVTFLLPKDRADFTNATMIARAINEEYAREAIFGGSASKPEPIAFIRSANAVEMLIPQAYRVSPYSFIGRMEQLPLGMPDAEARVVVDMRTMSVVSGLDVRVSPSVMALQGNLTLVIPERKDDDPLTLRDVLVALKAAEASGSDIVNLVKMLDEAGAIHGKLEYR